MNSALNAMAIGTEALVRGRSMSKGGLLQVIGVLVYLSARAAVEDDDLGEEFRHVATDIIARGPPRGISLETYDPDRHGGGGSIFLRSSRRGR